MEGEEKIYKDISGQLLDIMDILQEEEEVIHIGVLVIMGMEMAVMDY